jgi:hypothetical protein
MPPKVVFVAAGIRAAGTVPEVSSVAFMEVNDAPPPEKLVAVTVFALKFPLASRATIVDAPLALAAVVRALANVPALIVEAFIAVIGIDIFADPLNEVAVPVAPPLIAIVLAV